jgi:aminoglycoside phosphotransferase (APT) family kinase protein
VRGLDSVVDDAIAWVASRPAPPPFGGPVHLIHMDLDTEHVMVNPVTGFINGIIDWTEAHLGDAARDFVFLVTWRGWHFAEEVLRAYSRAFDREFRTRLRYMAQLLSVMWLAFAHEQGANIEKHVRAVHHAFAPHEHA